eukprot:359229_1
MGTKGVVLQTKSYHQLKLNVTAPMVVYTQHLFKLPRSHVVVHPVACNHADTITGFDSIFATGAWAMSYVSSINTPKLFCMGVVSCHSNTISVPSIYSLGQQALYKSQIDSDGLPTMSVSSKGHYSAFQASLYCRSGTQNCTISCFGSGCYEFYVYYEVSASQLLLEPPACKLPKNRGEQLADNAYATWCPYIVSATEMTRSEFEDMKEERMRRVIENDPEQKEMFRMLQEAVRNEEKLIQEAMESRELNQFMEQLLLINDGKLSYVKWSSDIVWSIAGVFGMLMLFACSYAYRRNKEYEVVM